MLINFTKMHGAGNDFIFVNGFNHKIKWTPQLLQKICDRRFGIGCDQLFYVLKAKSDKNDFKTEIYNQDGSQIEMCGNGIRCFAKYVFDNKLTSKTKISVETKAGIITPEIIENHPEQNDSTIWVKVDMGQPILDGQDIPVNKEGLILNYPLHVQSLNKTFNINCVSMGNPHAVIYVDEVDNFPVEKIGPEIEKDVFFPNRVNTEFIQIINRKKIKMRVWERGAGETLACGTGACAATVASILNNKTDRDVTVNLKGGSLQINWSETDNRVTMTGPATTVFEGKIDFAQ